MGNLGGGSEDSDLGASNMVFYSATMDLSKECHYTAKKIQLYAPTIYNASTHCALCGFYYIICDGQF